MGVTRTEIFSESQNQLATIAKVLGHPARIAILQYVLKTKSCINSHLVKEIGLAQATISQHLKELKKIGIIKGTVEGTSVNYCIDPENWRAVQTAFMDLFDTEIPAQEDQCC